MENLDRCFFCCKNISQEKQNSFKDPFDSFNCDHTTVKNTKNKITLKHILQISNYLKVPKSILEEDSAEVTSSITTCLDCTDISKNLSDLCTQLEAINLKISHYFNLLADQILEIPADEDDEDPDSGSNPLQLSNFQKLVHEKCLFKVQQDNSDSQVDLEKSQTPPPQNLSDDTSNQSIILEEPPDEIKIEIKVEDESPISEIRSNPSQNDPKLAELHSCPFCFYLVTGPYDLLHTHITDEHPEHVQTEETEDESEEVPDSGSSETLKITSVATTCKLIGTCDLCGTFVAPRVLARHKKLFCKNRPPPKTPTKPITVKTHKCKYCGKLFANQRNLRVHLTVTCTEAKQSIGVNPERNSCPFCDFSVEGSYDLLHDHITSEHPENFHENEESNEISTESSNVLVQSKKVDNPNKIKCQQCSKTFSNIWNIRRHMITVHGGIHGNLKTFGNFKNASNNVSNKSLKTMAACDLCGKVVTKQNLSKHKRLYCRARKNLNGDDSDSISKNVNINEVKKIFKCKSCGTGFANRGNLRRHLREIETCRQGNIDDDISTKERFECSNCRRQYSRLDYIKKHIETEEGCKMGVLIDHDTGKKLTVEEASKEISKCEYCGLRVYSRNLDKHVKAKHKDGERRTKKEEICEYCKRSCGNIGNLRVHMLAAHGVEMGEGKGDKKKVDECGVCGYKYNSKRGWMRHLLRNKKCKAAYGSGQSGDVEIYVDGEGQVEGEEEETEVFLSIPEREMEGDGDQSLLMMMEDVLGPSEDPLQI